MSEHYLVGQGTFLTMLFYAERNKALI